MSMWTNFDKYDAGKCQKVEKVDKALEKNFQYSHIVLNALYSLPEKQG